MLKKRKLKLKSKRLRNTNTLRRLRNIYRLKKRIHSRYRVGFMMWQNQ